MRLYEGLFLLDPALASDWSVAEAEINRVMDRAEAQVVGIKNWDERRLAYPIGRHKRGLYALSYFNADPEKLPGIERDVRLSEKFLRALLVRRERMTEEDVQKSLAAEPPRVPSRYDDRGPRGADRGFRGRDGGPRGDDRPHDDRPRHDRPRDDNKAKTLPKDSSAAVAVAAPKIDKPVESRAAEAKAAGGEVASTPPVPQAAPPPVTKPTTDGSPAEVEPKSAD